MSRTNKGGARLRAITLFAGASAIAAGVFAAYGHKPVTESCDITPTSIRGSKTFEVVCSGLDDNALLSYRIVSGGDTILAASNLGSGDGSSPTNAHGLNNPTDAFSEVTSKTMYFNTASSGTTDSAVSVKLQKDSGSGWADVATSDTPPAYYLSFTLSNSSPNSGQLEELQVSGLVGSETIKVGPMDDINEAAQLLGWKDSGSGSPSGSGTSMSPYRVPNASPYSISFAASSGAIDKFFETFNNSGSTAATRLAVYDNSGQLIGISGVINVATQ